MLWSDDQPRGRDEELRRAQVMVRRAMLVLAVAAVVGMAVAAWHL
ncbi:hypothetical protein RVR_6462 [Actinacidiphila reveromycinica]|uniref:Uncharacterized protein n=1 Tax=Actinacidiphila reveromycinica TaxID=659352 RepID=A0A7U3UVN7_9ACTN|nr:hypothetical protein [Streptomyces sp. SN-593]BBA99722.1 hypothetical protein RVR_6462 [Streptomyces sp. SN-593]